DRARPALPVRAKPAGGPLGMAERWHAGGGVAVDRGVVPAVLVSVELRQLQRDLRLARCRDRPDDVDVDVGHYRAVRRRTEFGNRAPDRAGYHRRPRQTAGPPRRGDGRYARGRSSGRVERTLVVRINI